MCGILGYYLELVMIVFDIKTNELLFFTTWIIINGKYM